MSQPPTKVAFSLDIIIRVSHVLIRPSVAHIWVTKNRLNLMLFDLVCKRIDSFDLPKDQGGPTPTINAGETWIFLNANSLVLSTRQRWPVVVGRCASRQPKKNLPVTKRSATWELISAELNKVIKNQNRF